MTTAYPELKKHLYNEQGKLRHFVNIYVNDEDIRYLQKEQTALGETDTISIIPSVAGGSPSATAELPALDQEEVARYSRHLILPEVGIEGQKKLKAASVLCVGAGGLGSPVLLYLAAAGIGRIGIVDFDVVDLSNLQRQVAHGTQDVGRRKLDSAHDAVKAINPHVQVDLHETALSSQNALELFKPYDIIIDGTDNFPTRYLVNDACVLLGKPNVYGSIFRFEGQASVFATKGGPCYRCLYPEPPPPGLVPSCAEGGVLGVLPGIIGVIQATEAIKLILGAGEPLVGRFLIYDALRMKFRELKLRRDPECPVCGDHPTVTTLIDYEQFCGLKPAPGAVAPVGGGVPVTTVEELKAAPRSRRRPRSCSTSANPRDRHRAHRGLDGDPARRAAQPRARTRSHARPGRAVQGRRPQRQGGHPAPREGVRQGRQPDRRHPRLGRTHRAAQDEVLNRNRGTQESGTQDRSTGIQEARDSGPVAL